MTNCPYKLNHQCKHTGLQSIQLNVSCAHCDWYNNGTIETGAMPVLEWFLNLFKKK